jgi:hypothetical protein
MVRQFSEVLVCSVSDEQVEITRKRKEPGERREGDKDARLVKKNMQVKR